MAAESRSGRLSGLSGPVDRPGP